MTDITASSSHTRTTPTPTAGTGNAQRLVSLDVLRGLTVMLMIFVNNGAGNNIFPILEHAMWNGMTLADMVFPFFLFIMGVAMFLSMKKFRFEWSAVLVRKILKRTILLFVIGLAINWLNLACDGRPFDLGHLRIMGVMQRISLCYGLTAFTVLALASLARTCHTRHVMTGGLAALVVAVLIGHSILLLAHGGYDYDAATNILARIDLSVMGFDHLYHKSPVDPEGLGSTLAAACNTIIGFLLASLAFGERRSDKARHALRVFADGGGVLIVAAALACGVTSLNKRVWSPSYVLMTCALAAMLQALLIAAIDVRQMTRHGAAAKAAERLTLVFGTNPLFLYVASDVLAIILATTHMKDGIYNVLHDIIASEPWASVAYSLLFLAVMTLLGWPLWKRRIFIKL